MLGSTILTASPTMEVSAEVAPAPTPEEPMSWIDELEQQLKHEIASSRAVVAEHADSDEVTAPAALWDEALAMLLGSLSNASPETIAGLPLPTISDGYDGTIDVSWRFQSRHLLLTLQGRDTHTATFSGRIADSPIDIFQGEIDTQRSNHWLLCWLTQ